MTLRLPDRGAVPLVVSAGAVWCGVLVGPAPAAIATGVVVLVAGGTLRRPGVAWAAAALLAGMLSGAAADADVRAVLEAPFPSGPATLAGVVRTDPFRMAGTTTFLLDIETIGAEPATGVARAEPVDGEVPFAAGMRATVRGSGRPAPGSVRGQPVTGTLARARIVDVGEAVTPIAEWGNALRGWIRSGVGPERSRGRALLLGFLIGDTTSLSTVDVGLLRRAGLSHFVAVSGSNVALFLALWWILLAPLSVWRLARIPVGIAGLALFVVVTRGEPSVVRAAVTAAVVLVARGVGIPVDAWRALSAAVIGSILWDPSLARHVGFVLSVAATIGVVAGSALFRFRPAWASATLSASVSAQVAVTPVLVPVFGSIPLLSPLANLGAAPLVAASTAVGGVGALAHIDPLVAVGAALARAVMGIGEAMAPFPQLDGVGVGLVALLGAVAVWRPVRPVVLAAAAVAGALVLAPPDGPPRPGAVFLDVGQGDAMLVLGSRLTVLVDGGPDPVRLDAALRRWRIDRIDLVVATHVHDDHLGGLAAVIGRRPVGMLWHAFEPHSTPASLELLARAAREGVPVSTPDIGSGVGDGSLRIEVLGPRRRYASPNDQSIVLLVETGGMTLLLPGDIEVIAQRELGPVAASVLKVPHQGADTSDLEWLGASAGRLAVISVGPNDYGHPSEGVMAVLRESGARVVRTDQRGDVVVDGDP